MHSSRQNRCRHLALPAFRDAVVVGDGGLRAGVTTSELMAALEECAGWADVGKARKALAFLDARAESALESVSRAIFHERELPPPALQVSFVVDPTTTYRADFFWEAEHLVGEADGLMKYDDPAVLRAEKVRQERLERLGLKVVRWTWRELLVETDETISRIRCHLRR